MSEKCARCGEVGEDRRTLWMACFYAMEELPIPFEKEVLFAADSKADFKMTKEPTTIDLPGPKAKTISLGGGKVTTDSELSPREFYTLRVCKNCRGDWMQWIRTWFVLPKREATGTGVFVRKDGAAVELNEEEIEQWKADHGGAEPIRLDPDA